MTDDVVVERIGRPQFKPVFTKFRLGVARQGLSMGMALAMICSWHINGSAGWAIVHGLLSWLYVLYYVVAH